MAGLMGLLRRYPGALWLLFAGRLVTAAGFSFSFPTFTLYAANSLHVSGSRIGTVLLLAGLIGAGAKYVGGSLSDRIGRRGVMLLALGGRAATSFGIAWLIAFRPEFPAIAAVFVASNAFGQLFEPSSQAYVSDITSGRVRVEAFGLVRMGINAGWAIGPVLLVLLHKSYATAFTVTGFVFTFSFFLFLLAVREPVHAPRPSPVPGAPTGLLSNRPFLVLCLASMVVMTVSSQLVMTTSIYTTRHVGLDPALVPVLFSINGALVVLLQFPASRWMGRVGLVPALVLGSLCYGLGYGGYAFSSGLGQFALCIAVVTVGEVLVAPGQISLASELSPAGERGHYLGVQGLVSNLGWCLGPWIGGQILDRHPGPGGALWFPLAGVAACAALVFGSLRFFGPIGRTSEGAATAGVAP
ncbi:MAG: MFS transporter [Candidatus Brocadiae bacterium]|nr:MFS transporter [Candidatus Brocadiia bacterium]